jgi:hypothetical protein
MYYSQMWHVMHYRWIYIGTLVFLSISKFTMSVANNNNNVLHTCSGDNIDVGCSITEISSSHAKHEGQSFLQGETIIPRNRSVITPKEEVDRIVSDLQQKYQHQPIFLQAVQEMVDSIQDLLLDENNNHVYRRAFAIMTEPERAISFRVMWMDDSGKLQVNRGWRIEFNR